VAGNVDGPNAWVSAYSIKHEAEREYLTPLGFSLGMRRLVQKQLIESGLDVDYNGNDYSALRVTESGWVWIDQNESRFVIRREIEPKTIATAKDDDIPF